MQRFFRSMPQNENPNEKCRLKNSFRSFNGMMKRRDLTITNMATASAMEKLTNDIISKLK